VLDTIVKCGEQTKIAVSRPEDPRGGGATTACRSYRAPFFTWTKPNGRILILDGSVRPDADKGVQPQVLAEIAAPQTRSGYRVRPPERLDLFARRQPRALRTGVPDAELGSTALATKMFLCPFCRKGSLASA
jgi:hypothetical protein